MNGSWQFQTQWGTFAIIPTDGRFEAMFNDERLGSYHSPGAALGDLVGGHTSWPSNGLDPSKAGLPDKLSEWTLVRR